MKRYLQFSSLLLLILAFAGVTTVQAQSVLPKIWLDTSGTFVNGVAFGPQWFKSPTTATNGNVVRGMGFNPVTNHVLVATRDSAYNCIMILNAANGDTLGRLNMTGITGGAASFNRVAVSSDGRIYSANLQTTVTKAAPVKIYTWADENAAPTVAFSDSVQGPRIGDALAVVGSGQETYVYLSGNATPGPVHIFKRSGDTLLVRKSFVPTGWASGILGFGPLTNGLGTVWINTAGKPAMKYDTTGAPLDTISTGIVSSGASTAHYFEFNGRKFVAMFNGNTNPAVIRVVDVTNGGSSSFVVGITAPLGVKANTNGTGEVIFNPADTTLIGLSTNNGVGKFSIPLSAPGVTFNSRLPFVPQADGVDTVFFNLLSMKSISSAQLAYYGYRTVNSDQNGIDSASVPFTQYSSRVYQSIIPASVNRNGRRISFRADVTDAAGIKATVLAPGYYAGVTRLAYTGGPREVDTNGVLLYKGYGIRSRGVVIVEDSIYQVANNEIVVQDSTLGGVTVFRQPSGGPLFDVKRGNVYEITGTTDNPTGGGSKFQFVDPGISFTDLGPAPQPIVPKIVTIKELITNGELLENTLVMVRNVTKAVSSPVWPAAGASQNMIFKDASGDSTTMRIDSDTDIDGTTEPVYPITIVGDAGQFDNTSPFTSGYQWLPRDMKDILFMPTLQSLNFESPNTDYTFLDFSGAKTERVPNPQKNGIDTSNFVVKMVKGAGDVWAGSYLTLDKPVDFKGTKLFKVKVFMPKVGAKLLLKFENLTTGGINMEKEATGTKANAWEELIYDFSAIDTSKTYQKVVLIGDLGTAGDGSANFTYLIDDIQPYIAPIVPMGVTLTTGKIQTTVTNVGHIGGVSAFQDKVGFKIGGSERLFEGSLIFTTDSAHVSNAWRLSNGDYSPGFRPLRNIKVDVVGAQTRTETMFDDSNMVRPLGISVLQRAFVDTTAAKAGYLMMQLNVINNSNAALSKLKVGAFLDFDMTAAGNVDRGGIIRDSTNTIPNVNGGLPFKMFVAYQQQGGVNTAFGGFVSVSQGQFGGGRIASGTLEIYPTFTDSLKNNYVSIFRPTNTFTDNGKNDDQSIVASVGAFNINSKDTAKIAFAVISGNSLGDLIATARQAQKDYAVMNPFGPATEVKKGIVPVEFALDQNYPNPFNPTTTIRFALPNDSKVSMKIYDVLGREVRTLINGDVAAGTNAIEWNGKNNFGTSVASGMYIYRIEAGSFVATKKMMLLK
jgi:hypothetical protein